MGTPTRLANPGGVLRHVPQKNPECLPDSKHGQSLRLEIMKCKALVKPEFRMSSIELAQQVFLSNKLVQSKCSGFMEWALFHFSTIPCSANYNYRLRCSGHSPQTQQKCCPVSSSESTPLYWSRVRVLAAFASSEGKNVTLLQPGPTGSKAWKTVAVPRHTQLCSDFNQLCLSRSTALLTDEQLHLRARLLRL